MNEKGLQKGIISLSFWPEGSSGSRRERRGGWGGKREGGGVNKAGGVGTKGTLTIVQRASCRGLERSTATVEEIPSGQKSNGDARQNRQKRAKKKAAIEYFLVPCAGAVQWRATYATGQ